MGVNTARNLYIIDSGHCHSMYSVGCMVRTATFLCLGSKVFVLYLRKSLVQELRK